MSNLNVSHKELFDQVPVGNSIIRYWAGQNQATLDSAAAKIAAHGANPWVFAADSRHFWQFANAAEKSALLDLTTGEYIALLGMWD